MVWRSGVEVALRENGTVSNMRAAVTSTVEETDRIVALAEDLLVLAGPSTDASPRRPANCSRPTSSLRLR
jgi:hypothetical protein